MTDHLHQSDPALLAVLHRSGGRWAGLVADMRATPPRLVEARSLGDDDEAAGLRLTAWIEQQRPGGVLAVLPANSVICRTCTLPMADDEQLQAALELQSEALLQGSAPAHRVGLAALPAAPAETSRTGVVLAWPEAAAGLALPDLGVPVSFVPDVGAVAALLNGQRPDEPLLLIDRPSGSIALGLSHASGLALRAAKERTGGASDWPEPVTRVLAETALNVGHTAAFVERLSDTVREEVRGVPADGAILLLAPMTIESARGRLAQTPDDPQWWSTFGVCVGAILARSGALHALTRLQASLPTEAPSLLTRISRRLAQPRTAVRLAVACGLLVALGPLAFNWSRLQVLQLRHGDIDRQMQQVQDARDMHAMYDALAGQRWTMTKLLADLACNTPEGIDLESITVDQGDAISVSGTAKTHEHDDIELTAQQVVERMQFQMQESGIFEKVSLNVGGSNNFGTYEFSITAKVIQPHRSAEYDRNQDFGAYTLQHRIYGIDPEAAEPDIAAVDVETVEDGGATEDVDGPGELIEQMMASADEPSGEIVEDDAGDRPNPRTSGSGARSNGRRPRIGGGAIDDKVNSIAGGDTLDGVARGRKDDIPAPLTQEEVDAMGDAEVMEKWAQVARSMTYAKSIGDDELHQRLKKDFDMLMEKRKKRQ